VRLDGHRRGGLVQGFGWREFGGDLSLTADQVTQSVAVLEGAAKSAVGLAGFVSGVAGIGSGLVSDVFEAADLAFEPGDGGHRIAVAQIASFERDLLRRASEADSDVVGDATVNGGFEIEAAEVPDSFDELFPRVSEEPVQGGLELRTRFGAIAEALSLDVHRELVASRVDPSSDGAIA